MGKMVTVHRLSAATSGDKSVDSRNISSREVDWSLVPSVLFPVKQRKHSSTIPSLYVGTYLVICAAIAFFLCEERPNNPTMHVHRISVRDGLSYDYHGTTVHTFLHPYIFWSSLSTSHCIHFCWARQGSLVVAMFTIIFYLHTYCSVRAFCFRAFHISYAPCPWCI